MPSAPQVCPTADIPLAAQTIATVFCQSYQLISFVYGGDLRPLPEVPYSKLELLTIFLYQGHTGGLVLTVNDDDQKCVGVAVWSGPIRKGFFAKLRAWCVLAILHLWLIINMIYYGGAGIYYRRTGMNRKVKCL